MPAYPARAIVLRRTRLGEADMIITLLAEDGRQIRGVAKGLRKPTSKFGGRLEPGAEIDLLLHTGKNLDVISEAQSVDGHARLREDFDRQMAAAVVEDLLECVTRDAEPDARLFGLARATLSALESAPVERLHQVVLAFLVKAMAMHGYRPELEACVACAGDVDASDLFSLAAGGALCVGCGADAATIQRLAPAGRAWLGRLLGATMAEVADMDMPRQAALDCFDLVRSFVAYHLPTRLKALDFYAASVHTLPEPGPSREGSDRA